MMLAFSRDCGHRVQRFLSAKGLPHVSLVVEQYIIPLTYELTLEMYWSSADV